MEVAPITFRAYRTVFMPNKNVLMAIPSMVMDFLRGRALQSKMAICFIVFTMAFTVVFPTFAGAMTGYSANAKAYINATDGNFVPFDAFRRLTFIIHDGSRVNLTDDYAVPYYDFSTSKWRISWTYSKLLTRAMQRTPSSKTITPSSTYRARIAGDPRQKHVEIVTFSITLQIVSDTYHNIPRYSTC